MKKTSFLFVILLVLACTVTKADSPVTSTTFYTEYLEYPIVQYAEEIKEVDSRIAAFLLDDNEPVDVKAAVINAISWDYSGSSNAQIFLTYLQGKYSSQADVLSIPGIRADEMMCYGYLMAMDDYFDVLYAATVTQAAADKSNSYTIHLINAIVIAQKDFDYNWCQVWSSLRAVINNKSLFRDIKRNAIQICVDYMILYKSYC